MAKNKKRELTRTTINLYKDQYEDLHAYVRANGGTRNGLIREIADQFIKKNRYLIESYKNDKS